MAVKDAGDDAVVILGVEGRLPRSLDHRLNPSLKEERGEPTHPVIARHGPVLEASDQGRITDASFMEMTCSKIASTEVIALD